MKITITQRDRTVTVEEPTDDQTVEQMAEAFSGLLVAQQYSPACIQEAILGEDDVRWRELVWQIMEELRADIKMYEDDRQGRSDHWLIEIGKTIDESGLSF